jgi:glycosyltransferase involved in cell wall biosynthesis
MEPLGESQVLNYLKKISLTHKVYLISFEKWDDIQNIQKFKKFKQICSIHQINWKPLRYSRLIRYVSSLKNIFNLFIQAWRILIANNITVVHIRSYMPGVAALPLKKIFKFSLVFDMRGLWADEKVDRLGWKKNQLKYKFFKFLEAKLLKQSKSIITLTNSLKSYLIEQGYEENKITTIRTCVDLDSFYPVHSNDKNTFTNFGYLGSTDTAYDIKLVLELFSQILRIKENARLKIFTKSDPEQVYRLANKVGIKPNFLDISFCNREDLNAAINELDAILFYLKPSFALLASMPTKIGESLGCNVPIICNAFNEDIQELMSKNDAGKLIEFNNTNKEALETLNFIENYAEKSICRDLAISEFNLELGAKKISDIYHKI